jgi:putative peptide zinc metalloprotease protein
MAAVRPLFSPSWYRVAGLTPRLRSHARIHRHTYRGETWYVLQDLSSDRFSRFSPAGYFLIGLMDGRRTVQQIWEAGNERLGDEAPTQEEMIQLLSQLHAADVLQTNVPPDTAELLERHETIRRRRVQSNLLSVMAWRIPLLDPDRLLRFFLPVVRPFVSWAGLVLWFAIVVPGVILAVVHWEALTHNIIDRVLAPTNLLLLWLLFPAVKTAHEFGHAFMTRAFGGEVHDMGVMVLVLTPVPYVDASAAWAFQEKSRRILVSLAGVMVELVIATVALAVWLNIEPGPLRALAYNAVFIAGVSTLVFNVNPLLRFDGYYVLADLLEIPNLRTRATAYLGYLGERYILGRREVEPPQASAGERAWFVLYAVASAIYRVVVVAGITLFIAGKFFIVGVLLAAFTAIGWLVVPLARGAAALLTGPRLRSVRLRAIAAITLAAAAIGGVLAYVPAPLRTRAEGVVWIPDEAFVRAETDGFVERVVASPGARVAPGDVLFICRDPDLRTEAAVLAARLRELEARYAEQAQRDLVQAQIVEEERRYAAERLAEVRRRIDGLTIRSRTAGEFVVPLAENIPGRYVRRGEVLAYVVELDTITVRAVVSQADIALVRERTRGVQVRLAEEIARAVPALVSRIAPQAEERLPTPALGRQGGGQVAVDPTDPQGMRAIQTLFQVDLELPATTRLLTVGGRAYVRFDHGAEPLAAQWYRRLRRLFLSRFHV